MTPALRRKLDALVERREEIERLLADPSVAADQNRFRNLSREFSTLQPVADALAAEAQARADLNAAEAMRSDAELRELADDEIASANQRLQRLEGELLAQLVPRGTFDVIGGVLGDVEHLGPEPGGGLHDPADRDVGLAAPVGEVVGIRELSRVLRTGYGEPLDHQRISFALGAPDPDRGHTGASGHEVPGGVGLPHGSDAIRCHARDSANRPWRAAWRRSRSAPARGSS